MPATAMWRFWRRTGISWQAHFACGGAVERPILFGMVIQMNDQTEQELRRLAGRQGRALAEVVEAALRSYIEAEAMTDIESADVAATQSALVSELTGIDGPPETAEEPGPEKTALMR